MFIYFIPFIVAGLINLRRIGYESELYALRRGRKVNPIEYIFSKESLRIYRPNTGRTPKEKELITKSNVCSYLTWGIIIGALIVYAIKFYIFLRS